MGENQCGSVRFKFVLVINPPSGGMPQGSYLTVRNNTRVYVPDQRENLVDRRLAPLFLRLDSHRHCQTLCALVACFRALERSHIFATNSTFDLRLAMHDAVRHRKRASDNYGQNVRWRQPLARQEYHKTCESKCFRSAARQACPQAQTPDLLLEARPRSKLRPGHQQSLLPLREVGRDTIDAVRRSSRGVWGAVRFWGCRRRGERLRSVRRGSPGVSRFGDRSPRDGAGQVGPEASQARYLSVQRGQCGHGGYTRAQGGEYLKRQPINEIARLQRGEM